MTNHTAYMGLEGIAEEYYQLSPAVLTEMALARNDGMLSETGSLVVQTGQYTGRSPNDRFIVDVPSVHVA